MDLSFWKKISNFGVNSKLPDQLKKKVRLMNQLTFFSIFAELLAAVLWNISDLPLYALSLVFCAVVHSSTFVINYYRKYTLARVVSINIANLCVFFFCLITGKDGGIQAVYSLLIVACFAVFSFNEKKYLLLNLFLILFTYAFLEIIIFPGDYNLYFDPFHLKVLHYNHIIVSITFIIFFLFIISKENQDTEESIIKKNKELNKALVSVRKAEQKSLQNQKELQKALQIKTDFLSNMSHEIRTPLNAIIGFSQLMETDNFDEDQKKFLEYINQSSNNLLRIVNDILDLSKIESGNLKLDNTPFSITEKINEIEHVAEILALNKNLKLNFSISDEVHDVVISDPTRLYQVIINLISNAVKFTNEGHINCSVTVAHNYDSYQIIEFMIEDSGIGISEDHLNKIFKSFKQAEASITRKYGGTGLGLTICKKIIKIMGGHIQVKSEVNKGSQFIVTLPLPKSGVTQENISQLNTAKYPNLRVLVIDDNEMNQMIVEQLLTKVEISPTIVSSSKRALKLIENNVYDLILLDLQMPEINGFEFFEFYKEHPNFNKDTQIIAFTADVLEETKELVFEAGMNDILTKPISPIDLYSKIAKIK